MKIRWVKSLPTSAPGGRRDDGGERRPTPAMGALLAGLSLFAGLSLLACRLGDRASAGGRCPPGEICSDRTPDGLVFIGASSFKDHRRPVFLATAVGGKQTISARHPTDPDFPLYVAGFEARLVDSRVIAIDSATPTSVVLRGVGEGNALLRLLEPGTNELLDRVEVEAAPVAWISFLPRELRDEDEGTSRWAVLAGGSPALGVLLFDQDDRQLVDEGLEVTAHTVDISRQAWDLHAFTAPSAGPLWLTVRAGGRSFTVPVPIESSIDDIQARAPGITEGRPVTLKIGAIGKTVCFVAMSGSTALVGARWRFQPAAGISVTRPTLHEPEIWAPPGCVTITGQALGPTTLRVVASDHRKTFDLVVEP